MKKSLSVLCSLILIATACRHQKNEIQIADGNFPAEINKILLGKCATSGCHDHSGFKRSGGLLLDSWDHLLDGGNNGAAIIAYQPEYSSLLYHTNSGHSSDRSRLPAMPSGDPLSHEEYLTIKGWIQNGAPDKNGTIPFASKPESRQKIYLAHGGNGKCKLIAIIDGERNVVMKYIPFGTNNIESAHNIRVSPDGRYAYACFISGRYIQKIDTRTDEIVDSIDVGIKQWGVINMSNDGKRLMVNAWEGSGGVYIINTETMNFEHKIEGSGLFIYPHGIISNATFDTFYVSSLWGNTLYKFSTDLTYYEKISLDGKPNTHTTQEGTTPDPHDLAYSPDYSKYLVTCQNTNEVRIFNAYTDSLIAILPVGIMPQHIAVSRTTNYAVIACMHDHNMNAKFMGSVYVINYKTMQVVKKIEGKFYEPHCVLIDDKTGVFYVLSKNFTSGYTDAYTSICGAKNGWYSVYDMNTLNVIKEKVETEENPYFADTRFK